MNERNSKKTLLVVGHSILDTIYDPRLEEPITRFGGIHNVARSFREISLDDVIIEPISFGEAKIVVNQEDSDKDVCAHLNKFTRTPSIKDADWMHIAYQNELNWTPPENFKGIVSTDWCKGNSKPLPKNTHYAFVSSDEFNPVDESIWNPDVVFIAHCPEKVEMWQSGLMLNRFFTQPLDNLCVLAAGDNFAACFIASKFNSCSNATAVEFAIQNTRQWLLSQ